MKIHSVIVGLCFASKVVYLPHLNLYPSAALYPIAATHGQAPNDKLQSFDLNSLDFIRVDSHLFRGDLIGDEKLLRLPSLATDPPTIFVVVTFVSPHPSFGVNKRPLIDDLRMNLNPSPDLFMKLKVKPCFKLSNWNQLTAINIGYSQNHKNYHN